MFSWWRARKKKVLINLPFINRTITKAPEKPKVYSKKEIELPVVKENKTPLKANAPSPTKKEDTSSNEPAKLVNIKNLVLSNSVSINSKSFNEAQESKKDDEPDLSNRPKTAYTHDEFLKKWNAYKEILLKKGKVSLATVFEYQPVINEDIIELLIENKALEDEFNHHKPDFIEYIRSELKNYNIQVSLQINKEFKTKKAYTPQEKYEKMIEKNPALALLKRKLDMDIGYS